MTTDEVQEQTENASRQGIRQWFSSPLGSYLLEQEDLRVRRIMPKLFGYHVLQIGNPGQVNFLSSSNISHKIRMFFNDDGGPEAGCNLLGDREALAIASDSVDVVVMPHVLEFVPNPHRLLREVGRILIGEGHLLITGFHPWSLWGATRWLLFWREEPPWDGQFYGFSRIKDWLALLDFELMEYELFFFRPPLQNPRLMRKLGFWEKIGKHCWPFLGGIYVILAKKRVVPLTPVKLRWRERRQLIASGILDPGAPV